MFELLQRNIRHDLVRSIYRVKPVVAQQPVQTRISEQETITNAPQDGGDGNQTVRRKHKKVRPNEPCPCGSGKKYKHCHGAPSRKGQTSPVA